MGDLLGAGRTPEHLSLGKNSYTAWKLIRALADLDDAYGQGDTERACTAIDEIKSISLFK
jgi:hypothetical protein